MKYVSMIQYDDRQCQHLFHCREIQIASKKTHFTRLSSRMSTSFSWVISMSRSSSATGRPVIPEEELGSAVGGHRQPPWFQWLHRAQKSFHQLQEDLLVDLTSSLVALELRKKATNKNNKRLGEEMIHAFWREILPGALLGEEPCYQQPQPSLELSNHDPRPWDRPDFDFFGRQKKQPMVLHFVKQKRTNIA